VFWQILNPLAFEKVESRIVADVIKLLFDPYTTDQEHLEARHSLAVEYCVEVVLISKMEDRLKQSKPQDIGPF
jgi:hypothetical protein